MIGSVELLECADDGGGLGMLIVSQIMSSAAVDIWHDADGRVPIASFQVVKASLLAHPANQKVKLSRDSSLRAAPEWVCRISPSIVRDRFDILSVEIAMVAWMKGGKGLRRH